MISVCIPIYNYNIQLLIDNLLSQFKELNENWEIILSDDNSSEKSIQQKNKNYINFLQNKNIFYFEQPTNIGNAANRNFLAKQTNYSWLLFLDADVLPVYSNFILNYLKKIKTTTQEIIGGDITHQTSKNNTHLLRWRYGVLKEEKSLQERNKNPLIHSRGANFAIKKKFFNQFKFPILKEKYGLVDTRFFLQFNPNNIVHIENPVYHLGLETNKVFVAKIKNTVKNSLYIIQKEPSTKSPIALVSTYKKIRFLKNILSFLYKKFHKKLERNLYSNNPSVALFQLYKVLYLAYLDASLKSSNKASS